MGSILAGDSDFLFVPRSCHVDQFTFSHFIPSLKFTIFIHLEQKKLLQPQYCVHLLKDSCHAIIFDHYDQCRVVSVSQQLQNVK